MAGALLAGLLLLSSARTWAASTTVGPGETLTLEADLVLQPGDDFAAEGTAEAPCLISAQGHSLLSSDSWQGNFSLKNCVVQNAGLLMAEGSASTPPVSTPAIKVAAAGHGSVVIENTIFDACEQIAITAADEGDVRVVGNTVKENATVDVIMTSGGFSEPAFYFNGSTNTHLKVFQGNRVLRSGLKFQSTQNWLIGGDNPGEGNIIVGRRGGISIENGTTFRLVGNYIHSVGPLVGWNQVKALELAGTGILVEHNIARGGNWLVDLGAECEVRYNLFADSYDRPWLLLEGGTAPATIHHNVFIRTDPNVDPLSGVWVLHRPGDGKVQIFNNTFHGGGKCWQSMGPGVEVYPSAFLDSLRSNAIVEIPTDVGENGATVTGGGPAREKLSTDPAYEPINPPPARLGYADYNLFYNPDAARKDNYGVAVEGATERATDGFARHDQSVGGAIDQQVKPGFTGPIPLAFPYEDADVVAGVTTACQILKFYRRIFTPAPASPLIDSGDPQDGEGNDIGAVGAGVPHPQDLFGQLCAGDDVGSPQVGEEAFKCTRTVTGVPTTATPEPGFICVCEVGGPPNGRTLGLGVGLVGAALWRRRRKLRSN